jgi:hypothetical protein
MKTSRRSQRMMAASQERPQIVQDVYTVKKYESNCRTLSFTQFTKNLSLMPHADFAKMACTLAAGFAASRCAARKGIPQCSIGGCDCHGQGGGIWVAIRGQPSNPEFKVATHYSTGRVGALPHDFRILCTRVAQHLFDPPCIPWSVRIAERQRLVWTPLDSRNFTIAVLPLPAAKPSAAPPPSLTSMPASRNNWTAVISPFPAAFGEVRASVLQSHRCDFLTCLYRDQPQSEAALQ